MEGYIPIGTGYQQIGGQPMVPRQKKFHHLKGVERDIALLDQARNPRQAAQRGYGGLNDFYAMNRGVDPITNMAVAPSQFDVMQKRAELAKGGEFEALNLFDNYRNRLPGSGEALMDFRNMRQAQQQFGQRPAAPANPYTPPSQSKPLYVPTGQPQAPANVPQLASDASSAIGNMLSSAMPNPSTANNGIRRISSPYGSGSSVPVARGQQPQQGGFDMQAAVARNRAALDAKYPTPQTQVSGQDYVTARPQPQTPRLLSSNPYGVVNKTPSELMDSAMLNAQGERNLAAPPSVIRDPSYYSGIAPRRNLVPLAGLGLEGAKQANFQDRVNQLNRIAGMNEADSLEFDAQSPAGRFVGAVGGELGGMARDVGSAYGSVASRMVNPYGQKTYDALGAGVNAIGSAANSVKNFFVSDKDKLAKAAALRKKYQ